ncbi:MAG TPA: PHP domain-containing protein [Candidatus Thermoplasmatota archaeon]|nr:PHP domain-containing protein [Candidatus Thermoplasmatota archaeon]
MSEPRVDLHTHTVVSDGTLTPTELVHLAARKGLAAIALTDHDHLGGLDEARRAAEGRGVEVLAGVELSVTHDTGADVHLLGYLVDPEEPRLARRLAEFRDVRAARGRLIVEKLRSLGVDISLDELPEAGSVGRPHIARALMEKRIVASVQEAFEKWLGEGRPAYVPKAKMEAREAIDLVHGAGGVAVLAHPGLLSERHRYAVVRELAALGLDGVEVEHSRHSSEERRRLRAMAQELGLVETGGSDFHGENKPDVDLGYGHGGNVHVTYATVRALRERAERRRSPSSRGTTSPS